MSKAPRVPIEITHRVRDTCLCLHVQRAARLLARRFDEALRPLDLTNGQFSLLLSLNRPAPVHMAAVAALLAMDRTTLTAALKPLQRRDLVQIMVDPADKRSRLMTLTTAGHALLLRALPSWRHMHGALEQRLIDGTGDRLRRDLAALVDRPSRDAEAKTRTVSLRRSSGRAPRPAGPRP